MAAPNQQLKKNERKTRDVAEYIRRTALLQLAADYAGNTVPDKNGLPKSSRTGASIAQKFSKGNQARYGWPALSPDYAKRKAEKFPGRPMLVQTGELKKSVIGRGAVSLSGDTVSVTFTVPSYGVDHLKKRNWLKPSPAELLALTTNAKERIANLIKAFNR